MTVTSFAILQLSGLLATGSTGGNLQPVTPHASAEARNVPDYLKRVYNHELVTTRDELPDWK